MAKVCCTIIMQIQLSIVAHPYWSEITFREEKTNEILLIQARLSKKGQASCLLSKSASKVRHSHLIGSSKAHPLKEWRVEVHTLEIDARPMIRRRLCCKSWVMDGIVVCLDMCLLPRHERKSLRRGEEGGVIFSRQVQWAISLRPSDETSISLRLSMEWEDFCKPCNFHLLVLSNCQNLEDESDVEERTYRFQFLSQERKNCSRIPDESPHSRLHFPFDWKRGERRRRRRRRQIAIFLPPNAAVDPNAKLLLKPQPLSCVL